MTKPARLRMLVPPVRTLHTSVRILKQAHGNKRQVLGRHLQKRRQRILGSQPLCVDCKAQGRVTLAQELDHEVPLAEGGADTDQNSTPRCIACHRAKSERERKRRSGG